jgi:protein-disulfide isomerase
MRGIALATLLGLSIVTPLRAADPPVATVGTRSISRDELEKHVKPKLIELDNERYEALREGLDEMIADELVKQEAAARKVTPEALEKTEVLDKVAAPSDDEIQKLYDENKDALNNAPLDGVKPRLVDYLKQQKGAERREAFVTELRAKYKTSVALSPPIVQVATAGRPERGPAKAPVTIIEFSDYECPFCQRAEPVVEKVMTVYKDQIRLVFRDFPLGMHAHARGAAEAAACANAQGKFWEYHSKLFTAKDIAPEKLKALAGELGLDQAKFDQCFDKAEFKAAIDKDIADGNEAGVTGTPAFFVNGRMLSGAQPFEKFKEVIDEEIARSKSAKPS